MDRADDDSAELFVGAHELRRGWFTGSTGLCRRRRSAQDALGRGASLNGAGGELQVKLAQFTATRRAIHGALWHDLGCMGRVRGAAGTEARCVWTKALAPERGCQLD